MGTRELEERVDDHVSISIVEKFANLSNPSSECCIFRMYDHLRNENEKAYEPSIVAIGPYHQGKAHLQEMELHKLQYLRRFLSRRNETSVNRYVMAIRELEDRARKCYVEETSILGLGVDSDQFVEMMLLDGFFIIELFRTFTMFCILRENQQISQSVQPVEELRDEITIFPSLPDCATTDHTESFLTNLVAFELCPSYDKPKYVCDYIVFMDHLINASKDVRLLNRSGIIESWVGDDAEVYSMWHKLLKITLTDLKNFGYPEVFINVNNHCKGCRNVWMANLKRNYFNSPWALISFSAATILLLLTVAQTIFSILSFGKGSF
ncbi:uncharacterized protein LOC114272167 [Camellia sinensis]|uniref:uncharacterized protein LOC114272167 n=1 Tax=Camellia sinensis TaxID=4442 RepID=UPI001035C2FD|nr:uncharacterized protein LOC114272167 [Camellia sinensis]